MGQVVHEKRSTPPVVPRYVPAGQLVGVVVANGQNCPAGHARQSDICVADSVARYVPGWQLTGSTDMIGQNWPVGQA